MLQYCKLSSAWRLCWTAFLAPFQQESISSLALMFQCIHLYVLLHNVMKNHPFVQLYVIYMYYTHT